MQAALLVVRQRVEAVESCCRLLKQEDAPSPFPLGVAPGPETQRAFTAFLEPDNKMNVPALPVTDEDRLPHGILFPRCSRTVRKKAIEGRIWKAAAGGKSKTRRSNKKALQKQG
jgi:hypothetical protein